MTPAQVTLARHALGLNVASISYRNRFIAPIAGAYLADWLAMVEAGDATRRDGGPKTTFHLTLQGARKVLRPGERLNERDFPEVKL